MTFNLELKFTVNIKNIVNETEQRYICFKHAVQAAIADRDVTPEIDEYGYSEYDFRDTDCCLCSGTYEIEDII